MPKRIITHHHHHGMINLMLIGITTAQHPAIVCKVSHAPLLPCSLQCESCNDPCSQLRKHPCLLLLDHELMEAR
jgi:hypothetical protein